MTATRPASKQDLTRERPQHFRARARPELVDLAPVNYLTIEGRRAPGEGQPGHDDFQAAIQALYRVVYPLKMQLKAEGHDFKVCTLQALWWGDPAGSNAEEFWLQDPESWRWKLMTMVPDYVDEARVAGVKSQQIAKTSDETLSRVKLEQIAEGPCVQMLHVGPYATEAVTIEAMREFMASHGLEPTGLHQEIYLGNPQRVAPDKLRTIVRQQVRAR